MSLLHRVLKTSHHKAQLSSRQWPSFTSSLQALGQHRACRQARTLGRVIRQTDHQFDAPQRGNLSASFRGP